MSTVIEEIKSATGAYEETFTLTGTMLTTESLLGVYYQIEFRWVEIPPQNYSVGGRQSVSFVDYSVMAGTKIKFEYVPDTVANVVTALEKTSESALDAGTATGGSTTTLVDSAKNWDTDIWKYALVEITGGTGVGQIMEIDSNTSDTLTLSGTFTTAPDTTSTYKIFGLSRTLTQNLYDDVTNELIAADISLSPVLDYGTASGGTATTLTESTKDWHSDVFKGAIVSIVRGTGYGQIRVISSNTSDTITVSSAFTTTPDTTSEYKIFGLAKVDVQNAAIGYDATNDLFKFTGYNAGVAINMAKEDGNLATIAGKDFSTETTLAALNTKVPSDPATESGNLASILAKLDVALSTRLADSKIANAIPQEATTYEPQISINKDNVGLATALDVQNLMKPVINSLVINNQTVDAAGASSVLDISGSNVVEVLISVGTVTGTPDITFHVQVVESASGAVIKTYDGAALTAAGVDSIIVPATSVKGDTIKVTWTGTLDASNYFANVYCRAIAKR